MSTPYRSLYLTFPDLDTATRIGRALVDERLVACVNLLPGGRSLYRWRGAVQEDDEVIGIAKTRAERVADVAARVRTLHPYDTPCVVAFPVADGDPAYLAWIGDETA